MRRASLLLVALCLTTPASGRSQESADVLAGLRNGGGWVVIPIERGQGFVSTLRMPTVGMTLSGCLNVWGGHSGEWRIRAHDTVSDSVLVVTAEPGIGVPFAHTFGLQAQVDFEFEWSEPRDTTLMVWVGIAIGKTPEEACVPVYGR